VKAVMPLAHMMTWLVWGWTQFPSAYTERQLQDVRIVVQAGANYLMACNLNLNDSANPHFVAQLGDHCERRFAKRTTGPLEP
jgi:hypothetical protein